MADFAAPRKLAQNDDVASFNCGQLDLNDWLHRFALTNQQSGMSTVFTSKAQDSDAIAGYYAVAAGGVEQEFAPQRVLKGLPRHPIPVILLTRLAVEVSMQGCGLGRGLLIDALHRVSAAADEIGARALLIHAKNDAARAFYLKQAEFEPSPTDPLHLSLLLKDLRKALR